jgi:hypothetical protein
MCLYIPYFHGDVGGFERRRDLDKRKESLLTERGIIILCPDYTLEESEFESFILNRIAHGKTEDTE